MKSILSLLGETFRRWSAHKGPRMGAALAFYTVFSLAPLVMLLLSLISLAVERNVARAEMVQQFRSLVGNEGADMVDAILTRMAANPTTWGNVVGFVVLLIGASSAFGELQDSLNEIWEVTTRRHPVFVLVRERVISFAMVLVMSLIMLISFLVFTVVAVAGDYLHGLSPGLDRVWELGNSGISLLATALLFALIFRMVPGARITWKDVWPGALIAAVLFVLGKVVLGFYFGRTAIASNYGAAGSLIIILVWVFYSAQILFFGAEFTYVYALRHGSHRNNRDPVNPVRSTPAHGDTLRLAGRWGYTPWQTDSAGSSLSIMNLNDHQPTNPAELSFRRMLGNIEEFACQKPMAAVAAAFGVGLLINALPARAVIGTVTVVGAMLMRPVLLSLGATKAMELCCQKTSTPIHS